MRISDWSSDVCSSDLLDITSSGARKVGGPGRVRAACQQRQENSNFSPKDQRRLTVYRRNVRAERRVDRSCQAQHAILPGGTPATPRKSGRSEEHTSELQSLMRISYAVFCLKTKTNKETTN